MKEKIRVGFDCLNCGIAASYERGRGATRKYCCNDCKWQHFYALNKPRLLEKRRQLYFSTKAQLAQATQKVRREYYGRKRQVAVRYYIAHRDKCIAQSNKYYQQNKQKILAKIKEKRERRYD